MIIYKSELKELYEFALHLKHTNCGLNTDKCKMLKNLLDEIQDEATVNSDMTIFFQD